MEKKMTTGRAPVTLQDVESHCHNLHGAASQVAEYLAEDGHFDAAGRVLLIGQRAYKEILSLRTTHGELFGGGEAAPPAATAAKGRRPDAAPPCTGGGRHSWGADGRCTRTGEAGACTATNPHQPGLPGAA